MVKEQKEYEEVSNQICKNINNQMCEKLTTPFSRYAALRVIKEHHFQDPDLKNYYKEVDGQIKLTEIDEEGNTFFHRCARLTYNHQLLGAFICTMNALKDKNPKNNKGITPLHIAAITGNFAMCKMIIENVKDKNPRNNNRITPLHFAVKNGHFSIVS